MTRRATFFLAALLFAATPIYAENRPAASRDADVGGLTVWGIVNHWPYNGLGLGMHYGIPVGKSLLTDSGIRDHFVLEFGADVVAHSRVRYIDRPYLRLRPAVGLLWTLWILDELALYPKIDAGYNFYLNRDYDDRWWGYFNPSVGLLYSLDDFVVRIEAGYFGLHLGLVLRY